MTDPNILAAVREALEIIDREAWVRTRQGLLKNIGVPPVDPTERHIEDLAREWCSAIGVDPDRAITFGEAEVVPGHPGIKFMVGTVRPAWTQFLDPAAKFAQALGIPVRKADKPGGYPLWIDPASVTEFRAVPMTRDDSSI